jgi:hypothetical protein
VDEVKEENNKRYCLVANIHDNADWRINKVLNDFKK